MEIDEWYFLSAYWIAFVCSKGQNYREENINQYRRLVHPKISPQLSRGQLIGNGAPINVVSRQEPSSS